MSLFTLFSEEHMAADFEIRKAQNGQYWWRLQGNNNEILCNSETFTTKAAAKNGIDAVKRVAPTAPVTDKTGEN
ncbi:MAG: DUF1508 domain-containing protein [Gemmatimonadaceae bacterium]